MIHRQLLCKSTDQNLPYYKIPARRGSPDVYELRDFVAADEQAPKKMLYPRNPDLDPQLVWKGKDEQDAAPLEVPVVPIYIQEKIHPQAIIEDFRRSAEKAAKKSSDDFGGLFADFNGLPADFDQRVDFYHHEGHWSNRIDPWSVIRGD